MKDYLERLQNEEIEILRAIDHACEELGINYVIISGTLLGAVRHKGFIPWDDDIDVGMTREDFDLFLEKGQDYLPYHLFIQHYTTEPNDNKIYIKVRNKNTIFIENDTEEADICHGIFVDVFPFDRCKRGKERSEYRIRKKFNLLVQCYSRNTIQTILNPIKRVGAFLIHYTVCKLVPLKWTLKNEEHRRRKLNEVGDDCYLLNQFKWDGTATHDELFSRKQFVFGQDMFWGPSNYDSILRRFYGDYMKIPPVEKQITHKPKLVQFEDE